MGFLKKAKQAMQAAKTPMTDEETAAWLATAPPEVRERYEANMAQMAAGRAEAEAAYAEGQAVIQANRILRGPAGDHLYGAPGMDPAQMEAMVASQGVGALLKASLRQSAAEFGAAAKQSVGRGGPPQIEDPAERAAHAAAERAQRAVARAPFRSPSATPATITRIATRGATQIDEVVAWLARTGLGARPDAVFGCYRVPDRVSPGLTPTSEKGRVVEWDVVHAAAVAPADPASPAAPAGAGGLTVEAIAADERWVVRRTGEPSVLDEDLVGHHLQRAGIGPDRVVGAARLVRIELPTRTGGDEADADVRVFVDGVVVLHTGPSAIEATAAAAPFALPAGPPAGTHIEVIDWDTISQVVHPARQRAHLVPSPFPYLPSTPQELLLAYLEVVGVRPADTYSAQVTVNVERTLRGRLGAGSTNLGPKLPVADGKARMRMHGSELVVVAYLDRPEYVEGRTRWRSYEDQVLQADLGRTGARSPVPHPDPDALIEHGVLRAGARVVTAIERLHDLGAVRRVPARYCWPPEG